MGPAWLDLECCEWFSFTGLMICRSIMSLKLCIFCCVFNVCLLLLLLLLYMPMQIQFLKWWSFEGCALKMHDEFFRRKWHDAVVSQKDVTIVGEWTCLRVKMSITDQAHWWFNLGASKCVSHENWVSDNFLVLQTKFLTRVFLYKKNGRLGVDSQPPKNPGNQSCSY